jgi:hypothetical protein
MRTSALKSYFGAIAVESLHTVNHNGAPNNKNRIAYPRFLACHQMWVQRLGVMLYCFGVILVILNNLQQ